MSASSNVQFLVPGEAAIAAEDLAEKGKAVIRRKKDEITSGLRLSAKTDKDTTKESSDSQGVVEPVEAALKENQGILRSLQGGQEGRCHLYRVVHMERKLLFTILVVLLGATASGLFLWLGLTGANQEQQSQFEKRASELFQSIEESFHAYETVALWTHETCRSSKPQVDHYLSGGRGICSRHEFRELHQHVASTGLEFLAMTWALNITDQERPALENETRAFLAQNYPDEEVTYTGIRGFQRNTSSVDGNGTSSLDTVPTTVQPRDHIPWYFVAHIIEPHVPGAQDFDLYSSPVRREALDHACSTYTPAITERYKSFGSNEHSPYSIKILHPGIQLDNNNNNNTAAGARPNAVAMMVVTIPQLLIRALQGQAESTTVYLFDETHQDSPPVFYGGAGISVAGNSSSETRQLNTEVELSSLVQPRTHKYSRQYQRVVQAAVPILNKHWHIVVLSEQGTYQPDILYVVLGGTIIFVACVCLAAWIYSHMSRLERFHRVTAIGEAERAALIIQNAEKATVAERELNDFIA